ncbi:hypothetical protein UNDYM_0005 [Undibacterium sp. YM2]|nr:hypothetical protein UNDYM_0005 [Undibacterium sp. YM2]
MALARRHRATYTRYADDISFSFSIRDAVRLPENICRFESGTLTLGQELQSIILENSFNINSTKNRLSNRLNRLEVTGITINEFPNVKRNFIDRIRGALHAWEVFGYIKARDQWDALISEGLRLTREKRIWLRQRRTRAVPELANVLWGKLLYLRMVRGADDAIYTRLAERYNVLCAKEVEEGRNFFFSKLPVEPIVRNSHDVDHAVFVVEWGGLYPVEGAKAPEFVCGQGTAFLYQSNNCLVTCEHVFRYKESVKITKYGEEVEEILDTGYMSPDVYEKNITIHSPVRGQTWDAKLVHYDSDRDLAILEFVSPPENVRHFTSLDAPIKKNEPGYLIGFPNWNPGRFSNQTNASVLNRFPRKGLQRIEVSTNVRKGNSGGPYVDELFRVAGIAQEGATQSGGNDECLCVSELNTWLKNSTNKKET